MFDQIKLADLADLAMGETIIAEDCDGKGFPIYSASTDEAPWNHSSHISRRLTPGTIVVGARGSIGFPRMPTAEKFGATQTTITVTSREGAVHPRFLFHALRNLDFKALTSQQAIPMLTVADLGAVSLPRPPLDEQAEIVGALDTLDTTIRQTEVIIEKLKQVKQGLLHDLLTRGIDANGELRPPQSEAPHLYKASPLGWIPTDWTDCALGSLLAGIDGGWSPDCQEVPPPEGCWGVLKLSAITSGKYLASESKTLPDTLLPDPSIEVHAGDVLLARANGVAELVATTVFVDSTPSRLMLSDKTLRLRPVARLLSPRFLALLMSFDSTRRQIRGMLNGSSGQQNISQRQITNLVVALPSFSEQQAIEARLEAADLRISRETQTEEKLRRTKSGLMDDLLTGRVRVTPLLAQQAA